MWGFTGILGKLIHLESLVIVWHRVLIAFLALGLFMVVRKYPMRIASFKDGLKLVGVGYRAKVENKVLSLKIGFSHEAIYHIPEDVEIKSSKGTLCPKYKQ